MEAVEVVRTNRLSLCRAADLYGIGKSMINDHVIKSKQSVTRTNALPRRRVRAENNLFYHIQAIIKWLK